MTRSASPTPPSRDRALRRLRRLTGGAAGTALGAAALFAAIAGLTIPGRSTVTAAPASTATGTTSTASDATGVSTGIQSSSSGTPHAVTGGS